MKREMEEVREKLNKIMASDSFDYNEALFISQMMDKLIIEYYKTRVKESSILLFTK